MANEAARGEAPGKASGAAHSVVMRQDADAVYLGEKHWPMVHTRQCPHRDGFYSAMRSLLPRLFFMVSLASHTTEFNAAMPDLYYMEQSSGHASGFRGPVPFLKIYDGAHLRRVLRGAGVTNALPFYACEAPRRCRKIRLAAGPGCTKQSPDTWRGKDDDTCWRGKGLWNETKTRCLPANPRKLAKMLADDSRSSNGTRGATLSPAHLLLDGAGVLDTDAPWTTWMQNLQRSARLQGDVDERIPNTASTASKPHHVHQAPSRIDLARIGPGLPSTAVLRTFDALRAAPAVREAADFLIHRHWGLGHTQRFLAYHLRRGNTYALTDRVEVMADIAAFNASDGAHLPGGASSAYEHFLKAALGSIKRGKGVDWPEINHLVQEGPAEMEGAVRRALQLADEPPCREGLLDGAAQQQAAGSPTVILSTFRYAQPQARAVLRDRLPGITVHVFDAGAWAAVQKASIRDWDPEEPLMQDAVETEIWMRAVVFIGGQSTMASMTKVRRHVQRGMAYDGTSKACVVNSQPCPADPKIALDSMERLACR